MVSLWDELKKFLWRSAHFLSFIPKGFLNCPLSTVNCQFGEADKFQYPIGHCRRGAKSGSAVSQRRHSGHRGGSGAGGCGVRPVPALPEYRRGSGGNLPKRRTAPCLLPGCGSAVHHRRGLHQCGHHFRRQSCHHRIHLPRGRLRGLRLGVLRRQEHRLPAQRGGNPDCGGRGRSGLHSGGTG